MICCLLFWVLVLDVHWLTFGECCVCMVNSSWHIISLFVFIINCSVGFNLCFVV